MFGLIRKKTVMKKMKEIKDGYRKENMGAKYPAETEGQKAVNSYAMGYEDGTDNFYYGLGHFILKK